MEIRELKDNKRDYMWLLLLADEQEDMVEKYLDKGTMFLLEDGAPKAECIVTDEGGILEVKNIAVRPEAQGKGYGRALLQFVEDHYRGRFHTLQAGTGDSPFTIPFYQKCGFSESHRVKNFFLDHYDHPIIEDGVLLTDMVYLRKAIG